MKIPARRMSISLKERRKDKRRSPLTYSFSSHGPGWGRTLKMCSIPRALYKERDRGCKKARWGILSFPDCKEKGEERLPTWESAGGYVEEGTGLSYHPDGKLEKKMAFQKKGYLGIRKMPTRKVQDRDLPKRGTEKN